MNDISIDPKLMSSNYTEANFNNSARTMDVKQSPISFQHNGPFNLEIKD